MDELKRLRAAGLTKAYIGVETGDDELLNKVNKGVNADEMLLACQNIVNASINLSVMVLLGLAGKGAASLKHALATAKLCNEAAPQYLAALTVTPTPSTVLYRQVQRGDFQLLDAFETLEEMKALFENITIDNLKFVGTHASNYLPITGTLQKDKHKMIAMVDRVLESRDKSLIRSESTRGL